ncbi:MAG: CARDB domain-containing protein [Candidatus Desantisbacteria bacterium]
MAAWGLTLTTPDGTLITPTYSTESVSYFNDTQIGVAGYTVKNPAAGTWTTNVSANNVSSVGTYSVEILVESTLICSLATDKNVYDPNKIVHITAMLANNSIPLSGASVTASVMTPATRENIILYDDGTHDDTQANDGTYTNTYANTNVSGNYGIVATAVGSINNQPFVRQVNTIIYVEQFPDLTIATSSITFSNNTPIEGEQVTINATINNIGDIGATNTAVLFYEGLPSEDGILIGSKTVSYISAGGSGDVSMIWAAANGTHTIQVIVSPYNSFLEKSYDNNFASKEIFVSSPDLSADISLEPSCPTSGEMATITAVVYNTGTTKADSVLVCFFIGNPLGTGTLIGSQTIAAIPANGSGTAQLVWNTSGYTGIAAIYVQIDPQNEILEADESNNLNYKEMYIQEVDTLPPTVEIISPSNNLTVSGVVRVNAAASDNIGITRVEFYIDGVFCIAAVSPFEYSWDTGSYTNSSHTIKVFAYDSSNLSGSNSITVTVDNLLPDTTPPGTITNLSLAAADVTSIAVTWTAPGDDAYAGTATAYDIRYAAAMITEDNWGLAVQAAGEHEPKPAGETETFTITNLQPCTTYYAAIKTGDNTGLWSGLSNITSATTLSAGSISITSTPDAANVWLDEINKGTVTPLILSSIIPGTHTIKLTKDGYHDWSGTVTVSAGTTTDVIATLTTIIVPTFLKITPAARNANAGEEFMVDVEVSNVKNMITSKIHLSFNPAVLELQEIGTGTFIESGNAAKQYDNTTGTIDYFAGLLNGSATGSGVICSMKFKAKAGGSSPVVFDFDESNNRLTRLKDADENNISFNKEEAVYNVITGVTGIKIKQQDVTARAGESIVYQCIAICDNNLEIDITGSATFTASGGGSFTLNAFLAKYSGTHTIQCEYAGLLGTTTVNVLPGAPCALVYVSGNNQVDNCTAILKDAFVVKAVDKYDNPCEGAAVDWRVEEMPSSSTGYSIYPTSTTTNASGIASSTLTLGSEPPGTYTICAVLPGLIDLPCTFTANSLRTFGNIAGFCLLDLGQGRFGTASQIQVRIEQTGATATITKDFIFSGIPVGTYTLIFDSRGAASRVVSNVRILSTQSESTTDIGSITLLAGDISNDGKINLADWPGFVNAFFKQAGSTNWEEDKQADFNHDSKVDDEDFIVLRNNFGKQTEGMVMKAPSMGRAAASDGNVELSFKLDGVNMDDLRVGNIIYLKVYIRNARDLLGAEVHLSFDPSVLEVVNLPADTGRLTAGDGWIKAGDYFTGDVWELMNRADNVSGTIDYCVGVLKAQQTRDEGVLAIVPFRIKAAGASSTVDFDFKEEENRQTFFIERRAAAGIEEKPVDNTLGVRSEEIVINVSRSTPDDIRVYPNPVEAGKNIEVIFDLLPAGKQVALKIYNLAGELVFEKSGVGSIRWGLQNGDNEAVASGVYVYSLRDGDRVIKQGKIGVVR